MAVCGFFAGTAGPFFVARYVEWDIARSTELAMSTDAGEAAQGVARLHKYRFMMTFDSLIAAYIRETDSTQRERLAKEYKELTGEEIDQRLRSLGLTNRILRSTRETTDVKGSGKTATEK
jgi:hypothetical protein